MTRVFQRLLVTTVVLGTVSCGDDVVSLDEGTSSTLAVRVYVDADGDGSFDAAADVPIVSVAVTASGTAGDVSGSTGADGLATLELSPGSYALSASGAIPAGAVLATASNPTVFAQFQGGALTEEFRYSFLPGEVSGVVFRDDNGDGVFNAADDTPAGGITVLLFSGSTAVGDTVASTTTATDGSFLFTTVRPGTYTVEIVPFPTITIVGGNTATLTVDADLPSALVVEFTGNLVTTVAEARLVADGDAVGIEGVVSEQVSFRTTLDAFMQDGTAGMTLFDFNQAAVQIGDSIRVVGRKGAFRGEVQIDSVFTLEVLASVGEPATTIVTAADINAGSFQSRLVEIDGTVDSLTADFFDNARVFLTDGAGVTFVGESDSRTGVASTDWVVGQLHTVIGVLGSDDRDALQYRLEVRSVADLVLGGSAVTLAAARGMDGLTVTVVGVLNWQTEWQTGRLEGFMQDATAGIALFDFGVDPTGLLRGDTIRVRGTVGSFRSEFQISSIDVFTVIAAGPPPTPRAVTGAEINADQFQGELVSITGTLTNIGTPDGFDNHFVTFDDAVATAFTAFVDSRSGITSASWTVSQSYDLVGPLGTDDRETIAARVELRDTADR